MFQHIISLAERRVAYYNIPLGLRIIKEVLAGVYMAVINLIAEFLEGLDV